MLIVGDGGWCGKGACCQNFTVYYFSLSSDMRMNRVALSTTVATALFRALSVAEKSEVSLVASCCDLCKLK